MLHIKLIEIEHRAPCKHALCSNTYPPDTWVRSKNLNVFFLKIPSYVEYQIKSNGMSSTKEAHIISLHTPLTYDVESKGQHIFLNVVMLHIKLMGKKYRPTKKKKNFDLTHTLDLWR